MKRSKQTLQLARMLKKASLTRQYLGGIRKRAAQGDGSFYINPANPTIQPWQHLDQKVDQNDPQYQALIKRSPNLTSEQKANVLKKLQAVRDANRQAYAKINVSPLQHLQSLQKTNPGEHQAAAQRYKQLQQAAKMNFFGRFIHNRTGAAQLNKLRYQAQKDQNGNFKMPTTQLVKKQLGQKMNNLGYSHFGGMAGGAALGAGLGWYLSDNPILRLLLAAGGGYLGGTGGSYLGRYLYNKYGKTGLDTKWTWNPFADKLA